MGVIATLILTTAIAGVVGTGLGGLVGAMLQKDSNRTVSLLMSFAGGVMLSVVCFDLVAEAIATSCALAFRTGAAAAIALPPQIEVPTLTRYIVSRASPRRFPSQTPSAIPSVMPIAV